MRLQICIGSSGFKSCRVVPWCGSLRHSFLLHTVPHHTPPHSTESFASPTSYFATFYWKLFFSQPLQQYTTHDILGAWQTEDGQYLLSIIPVYWLMLPVPISFKRVNKKSLHKGRRNMTMRYFTDLCCQSPYLSWGWIKNLSTREEEIWQWDISAPS
jgi:hypothetical protein